MPALHGGPVVTFTRQRKSMKIEGLRCVITLQRDLLQEIDRFVVIIATQRQIPGPEIELIEQCPAPVRVGVFGSHGHGNPERNQGP